MTDRRGRRDDEHVIDAGRRLVAERIPERRAWEVRRSGTLIGVVWREDRTTYRSAYERDGRMTQVARSFPSMEEAVRALDRAVR